MLHKEYTQIKKSSICPICHNESFTLSVKKYRKDLDLYEILTSCENCSHHKTNVLTLSENKGTRIKLKINSSKDLDTLIAKSNTASIRIKELGVEIDPAAASQGEIMSVKDVLSKIKHLITCMQSEENKEHALFLLERLNSILNNDSFTPFELDIEDTYGNSMVFSKKITTQLLTKEENEKHRIEIVLEKGNQAKECKKAIHLYLKNLGKL